MTVDASYISAISRGKYTVGSGSGDTIPQTTLTIFLQWASDRISQDIPSGTLTVSQIDMAKGLLVCHYIEMGSSDKTAESIDNYSYSRASAGSPWLNEYLALIKIASSGSSRTLLGTSSGVVRSDADVGRLRWDRNEGGI